MLLPHENARKNASILYKSLHCGHANYNRDTWKQRQFPLFEEISAEMVR